MNLYFDELIKPILKMKITEETLKQILEAFNRHDLDAIMEFFSDDCSFDFPRGPEFYGQRFEGKAQVREALASSGCNLICFPVSQW